MSRSLVYTLHLWPPLGHAKHYTGSTPEQRLPRRLTDHALGRGARLTQVQAERGGSWVVAQTEPGDRSRERQLKQRGAARRCEVCKAVDGYQAGQLTAAEALSRAGWDRASEHDRGLLLNILGIDRAPESIPARRPAPPAPSGGQVREVPAPRQPGPGTRHITPEVVALVDQLESGWHTQPGADAVAAGMREPEAGA